MASASNVALAALQKVTNAFASVAGFSPISVDGGMGANTVNAVTATQSFLASNGCAGVFGSCISDTTKSNISNLTPPLFGVDSWIMQNVGALTTTFTSAMAELGLSIPASPSGTSSPFIPTTSVPTGSPVAALTNPAGLVAQIGQTLGFASDTQTMLFLGIAGAAGYLLLKGKKKKGRR